MNTSTDPFPTIKRAFWFLGIVLIATIAMGASSQGDISKTAPGEPTVTTLPRSGSLDPSQEQVLADGSVTDDEMRATLTRVVACLRADGFDARLVEFRPGSGWHISVTTGRGDEASRVAERDMFCSAKYMSHVGPTYLSANALSPDEIAARSEAILACLVARGEEVEGMSLNEAVTSETLSHFEACEKQVDQLVYSDRD